MNKSILDIILVNKKRGMKMEQASLFDMSVNEPLASRMRPRNLNEFVGQDHLIGENKILKKMILFERL